MTTSHIIVKDSNRVSGTDRQTCPYFDEIDAILGTRAPSAPVGLLESSRPSAAVNIETVQGKDCLLYFLCLLCFIISSEISERQETEQEEDGH